MSKTIRMPKRKLIRKFTVTAISPIRALVVIESQRDGIRGVLTVSPEVLVPFIKLLDPETVVVPNPKTEVFPDDFESEILENYPVQMELL